jgi:hypothetical protein
LKLLKVTLEWNAVTTLEHPDREGWDSLTKIICDHDSIFDVGMAATAASENTLVQTFPETAHQFRQRLNDVGLGMLSLVLTQCTSELTYIGLCFIAPDHGHEKLIEDLWSIPPGNVPRCHRDFAALKEITDSVSITEPEFQKWRNHWCDVHSMLAHIVAKRDVFVTGDKKNFKGRKKQRLIDLGIGDICTYGEAWQRYGEGRS